MYCMGLLYMFSFQPQILDPLYAPIFSTWTGSVASIHSEYEKLHHLSRDSFMKKQTKHNTAQQVDLWSLQQDSMTDLDKSSWDSVKGISHLSTSASWPSALPTLQSPSQYEHIFFKESSKPMPFETSKSSRFKNMSHEENSYQMDNGTYHKELEEEHLSTLNTDTFLVCDMIAVVDMEEESPQSGPVPCLETPLTVTSDTPCSSLPSSPHSTSSKSGHVMIDTPTFKPPPLITLNTIAHSPATETEYIQLQDQQNAIYTRKPQSPLILNSGDEILEDVMLNLDTSSGPSLRFRHDSSNYAPNSISSGYVSESAGSESGSCGASSNYIVASEDVSSCNLHATTAVIELAESNGNTETQTSENMIYFSRLQLTTDALQSKQLQECQEHVPTPTLYWKTFDGKNTTDHDMQHGNAPNTDTDAPTTSNCNLPHYVNCPKDSMKDIEIITFDI